VLNQIILNTQLSFYWADVAVPLNPKILFYFLFFLRLI